jgi:hypothetical protein
MFQKEYNMLLDKIDKGIAKPCFAADVLQGTARKEFDLSETEKIYTWTSLIEAGSDTSRVAILQLIAGASCYPDWKYVVQVVKDCQHLRTDQDCLTLWQS